MTPAEWENLPDEGLLDIPVRMLGLRIENSPVQSAIDRLYGELDGRGITFHPPCYLADEWLCPDKIPVIGIPFYLAHPRLKQLEMKLMYEVEGGTEKTMMMVLRHEAGHALNYAYGLYRRTQWRKIFGPFSARYRQDYDAQPYSKRYVVHLAENYAQAHPDEDFAETFAVWLTPNTNWAEKYHGWPAIIKLKYVDRVMTKLRSEGPVVTARETPWSAARMRSTLKTYYERRRLSLGDGFPGFYDWPLQKIFTGRTDNGAEKASGFLRRHRKQIIASVTAWTGERKYDAHSLFKKLITRSDRLELAVSRAEPETVADITAFVTAVLTNVSRFKRIMESE